MCVDKKAAGDACTHGNQCLSESCWDNICCVIGDRIIFGNYEQDYDTTNGKEPIKWRVLDKNDEGQLFIISEKVLDVQSYNTTQVNITWEFSTIRSWLNGYAPSYNNVGTDFTSDNFIDAAFTAEEKAKIVTSNVIYNKSNATTDKVFLLSENEVRNYFANDSDRLADATRYVVRKNAIVRGSESGVSYNGTCTDIHRYPYWWLRSKESNTTTAHSVMYDGTIRESIAINAKTIGVHPVLWVNSF